MTFKRKIFVGFWLLFWGGSPLEAAVKVMTTTSNVANLVKIVGGDLVEVTSFTTGTQDPHFAEAKPSYVMKASRADLVVSVGLELEIGWLPAILNGARNPRLMPGELGSLVLGDYVTPLEVPKGVVSREHGDVHPDGNPHFMLDPIRAGQLALVVANRLGELDKVNVNVYQSNGQKFKDEMNRLTEVWQKQIAASGVRKLYTYHKTLTYFLARMGLESAGFIEPKPGVPPSGRHIHGLIAKAKNKNVRLILNENLFSTKAAYRIQKDVNHLKVVSVPVSVGGAPAVASLQDLYQGLVDAIVGGKRS